MESKFSFIFGCVLSVASILRFIPLVGPVLMCLVGPIYFSGATIFINASEKHINIGVK